MDCVFHIVKPVKLYNIRWFHGANHYFYIFAHRSTSDLVDWGSRREQENVRLKEKEWFFSFNQNCEQNMQIRYVVDWSNLQTN